VLVREAASLFESDVKRQKYSAGSSKFIVSPVNARKELVKFIKGAKKELLIYDVNVSDREVIKALAERVTSGVEIRVIGKVSGTRLPVRKLSRMRLHTRTIIRDRDDAFMGSQSLRALELDRRREIGVIFHDKKIIKKMIDVFEGDWKTAKKSKAEVRKTMKAVPAKAAKKLAKAVKEKLPMDPVVKKIAKRINKKAKSDIDPKHLKQAVNEVLKDALHVSVKKAAKHALKNIMTETVADEVHA